MVSCPMCDAELEKYFTDKEGNDGYRCPSCGRKWLEKKYEKYPFSLHPRYILEEI